MSADLSIGEVARRTGVAASALRYYERLGLLPKADRQGGHRVYPPEVLDLLAVVRFARRAGFSIREVSALFAPDAEPASSRWRRLASAKVEVLERQVRELRAAQRLLREVQICDCVDLQRCGRVVRRAEAVRPRAKASR